MRILLLTAVVTVFCAGAVAQAPPVKMGLWEKTMTIDNGDGKPETSKSKSCVTPAEWQAMDANLTRKREGCTGGAVKNAKGYTFNSTCKIGETSMIINGSTTIPDAEHILTESHSVMTRDGKTQKTDSRSTSHWLNASCGKIEPGDSEEEK